MTYYSFSKVDGDIFFANEANDLLRMDVSGNTYLNRIAIGEFTTPETTGARLIIMPASIDTNAYSFADEILIAGERYAGMTISCDSSGLGSDRAMIVLTDQSADKAAAMMWMPNSHGSNQPHPQFSLATTVDSATIDFFSGVNSTYVMRLDADGNLNAANEAYFTGDVGIGTTSPNAKLHVLTGVSGATPNAAADDLVVETGGNGGISLLTTSGTQNNIYFGTPDDNTGAIIRWQNGANLQTIGTVKAGGLLSLVSGNSTEAVRINASQNVGIGTDNPLGKVHVQVSSVNVSASAQGDDFILVRDGDVGMTLATNSGDSMYIDYSRPGDSTCARIEYDTANTAFRFQTAETGGELQFYTDNADRAMTIDASQNVGIGTTSPDGRLHVQAGVSGATAASGADDLIVEHSSTGGLSILVPDASASNIVLGTPSDVVGSQIQWDYNASILSINTSKVGAELVLRSGNSSEAVRLDASQIVSMPAVYDHNMNGETYRDLLINDSGELGYDSSTRRKKKDIQEIGDTSWIYDLNVVQYRYKNTTELLQDGVITEQDIVPGFEDSSTPDEAQYQKLEEKLANCKKDAALQEGLLAEEVAEGNPHYCDYNKDGSVEGIHYRKLVVPVIRELQKLKIENDELKAELAGIKELLTNK